MDFYYFIKNLWKKDFNLIPHSKVKFLIKLLLHLIFGTNLRFYGKRAITKFPIPKKIKIKHDPKKNLILIGTNTGLYIKDSNDFFTCVIENVGGFFGLDHHKGIYYVACNGSAHTKGCIYSFKIKDNEVYDFKIVFKKRFQYFHGLKIFEDNLFLVDSSWLMNHEIIHKFKINDHGLKKISSNHIDVSTKKDLNKFCHINSISFYKDKVYLLFHNMTEYTRINSEVLVFDKNFKFSEKLKFEEDLNSAHDFSISNKGKCILDSNNSILYFNNLKIKLEDYFIRGYIEDKEKLFIGLNLKKKDKKFKTDTSGIAELNKSNHRLSLIRKIKCPFNSINSLLKIDT